MATFTYFNIDGARGDSCRLALFVTDTKFTDKRVTFAEWQALKPTTPFGQLPIFELNGETIAESSAILRLIGKKHGLVPSDAFVAAKGDAVIDQVEGIGGKFGPLMRIKDEDEKKKTRAAFVEDSLKPWAKRVDAFLSSDAKFAFSDDLTIADLRLFVFVNTFKTGFVDHVAPDVLDAYANIKRVYDNVAANEKVIEWYKQRAAAKKTA